MSAKINRDIATVREWTAAEFGSAGDSSSSFINIIGTLVDPGTDFSVSRNRALMVNNLWM